MPVISEAKYRFFEIFFYDSREFYELYKNADIKKSSDAFSNTELVENQKDE
jgi:hypothetical protein